MSLAGKRVLLVEDEAILAMLVEDYLEEMGCVVAATAARLDDAIAKAGSLPLDLAVLDVNLGGELSYPVAELLRARGVPFIFATGYGAVDLPEALRGVPVLAKPFRQPEMERALGTALQARPN